MYGSIAVCAGLEQYLSGVNFPIHTIEGDCDFDKPVFYFEHGDFLIPAVSSVSWRLRVLQNYTRQTPTDPKTTYMHTQ